LQAKELTALSANNLDNLFTRFIRERQYINNLSPRTIRYHRACFASFNQHTAELGITTPSDITNEVLLEFIVSLKGKASGIKPVSVDSYIRGLNCFFGWLHRGGFAISPLRIPRPRFEDEVPRILGDAEIAALVNFRPRRQTTTMRRVHAIAMTCLDTGCRVNEVIGLRVKDVNLDGLFLRVMGKGRRERMVPFSPELRRVLVKYGMLNDATRTALVFGTRDGMRLRYDNLRRDYRTLCRAAGIGNDVGGFHRLRHTYATLFIRGGRGEIQLARILGHTSLDMTRRYVRTNVDDLRGVTPLSR
jgi:integrase/recombinase XerD